MSLLEFDLINNEGGKERYSFSNGRYTLGKGENCNIVLLDPHVSRHHASIDVTSEAVFLTDENSTNGVWKDGKRVERKAKLEVGDLFNLGNHQLIVIAVPEVGETGFVRFNRASMESQKQLESTYSEEFLALKRHIQGLILDYLDLRKRSKIHGMSPEELRKEARHACEEVIKKEVKKLPDGIDRELLIKEVVAEAVGLGALEPLLEDDSVTEIMVNGADQIYIERNGVIELSGSRFSNDQSLRGVIERIVAPLGRRIDEGSPMVDARLEDGSRVNAIIPPLALNGPTVTIRKFAKQKLYLEDLVTFGTLSPDMGKFLKICVDFNLNIIVSGGTGSGKTTLLNIMSNFISPAERIITIEDAAELQLYQDHVISLESRPANAEGKGAVSIRDLVINSLRMRPDRIIVGECRGGEALDMLQAMNTGHDGSMTTGHANTPRDILSRLEVMVMMAGIELPSRAIREQIAAAVNIIIQQNRLPDGRRVITEIVEVQGMEGDTLILQPIFKFKKNGITPDGRIKGDFVGMGYAPQFYEDALAAGIKLDRSIFGAPEELSRSEYLDIDNTWSR